MFRQGKLSKLVKKSYYWQNQRAPLVLYQFNCFLEPFIFLIDLPLFQGRIVSLLMSFELWLSRFAIFTVVILCSHVHFLYVGWVVLDLEKFLDEPFILLVDLKIGQDGGYGSFAFGFLFLFGEERLAFLDLDKVLVEIFLRELVLKREFVVHERSIKEISWINK